MSIEQPFDDAAAAEQPPIDREVEHAIAYQQQILARTPAGTYGLVAVCVALFGLQSLWGGFEGDGLVLYAMGSSFGPAVKGGELYRLLSAAFLHFGPVHLLMNMAALLSFGPLLERHLGTARYLVLYALSALAGSVLSVVVHGNVNSAGASGAVWGLMGGALALGLFPRGVMPRLLAQQLSKGLVQPLVINGIYSVQGGIDFAAHLGGGLFAFGLVALGLATLGLPRPFALPSAPGRPWLDRAFQLLASVATIAVAASMVLAITHGKPWYVKTPPPVVAVQLEGTSLTVKLPSEMAKPVVTADAKSGARTFAFGDLDKGTSQLTLRVFPYSPYDQLSRPEDRVEMLKKALPGAGTGLTLKSAPSAAKVGDVPAATEEMTGANGYRVRAWSLPVGDAVVVASLHQLSPSPAWLAAGEQMIASIQSSTASGLQWVRVRPGLAGFSLELPTLLKLLEDDPSARARPPGAQYGVLAVTGSSVIAEQLTGDLEGRGLDDARKLVFGSASERKAPAAGQEAPGPEVIFLDGKQVRHEVQEQPLAGSSGRIHRYVLLLGKRVVSVSFFDQHPTDALEPFHERIIASLRPEPKAEAMGGLGLVGGVVDSK